MIIFWLKYIIPLVASAFSQIFLHYEKITEIRRCDAILRARASR